MFVKEYEKQLLEYSSYRMHKYLTTYVPPILLLLGTIGNVLSIIILTRKSMRKFSTYFYLAILAAADTLVLYVGLLRLWVGELTGKDVRDQNNWTCKVISVLGYTVSDYSGWLIIAVTIERYTAVCQPLKAPSGSGHKVRAYKVVGILFALLLCINSHFFWTVEVGDLNVTAQVIPHCEAGTNYEIFINDIWPWIDTIIYSFLPFIIILTLNILIALQVVAARRDRRMLQTDGGHLAFSGGYMQQNPADRGGKITVMLMTISLTFLLTTLPMTITNIIARLALNPDETDLETLINFRLARTVTELLMYTNHCVNFFLYCATGQKFRKQFVWLVTQGRGSCGGSTTQLERRYSCYPGTVPGKSDYSLQWQTTNGMSRNTSRHILPLSDLMIFNHSSSENGCPSHLNIMNTQEPLLSESKNC